MLSNYLLYVVWNHEAYSMTCVWVFFFKIRLQQLLHSSRSIASVFEKLSNFVELWRIYCLGLLCCCFFFFSSSTNIDDGEIGCNIGAHCCTKWDYNILLVCVCVAILKGIISSTLQQSNIISSHTSILQGRRYVVQIF